MEQLYVGLTSTPSYAHQTVCGFAFEELEGRLSAGERLLSQYHFPLLSNVEEDLTVIYHFSQEIGMLESFLLMGQFASFAGMKWQIEGMKPNKFVCELPGVFIKGKLEPRMVFIEENYLIRELCKHCLLAELAGEINNTLKLLFNAGCLLVYNTPPQKIIKYWEN